MAGGYHSCHLLVGSVPWTESDIAGLIVPSGVIDEVQVMTQIRDAGALAYICNGDTTNRLYHMFPEGMGVDLDKHDYFYACLNNIVSGFTGAVKQLFALARVKVLFVER